MIFQKKTISRVITFIALFALLFGAANKTMAATTARMALESFMESKGWNTGWDPDKKRYFIISTSEFECDDPATDPNFPAKRMLYVQIATLKAKAAVIEMINTTMSAKEQLSVPGSSLVSQLGEEYSAAKRKLVVYKNRIAKLMEDSQIAGSDALRQEYDLYAADKMIKGIFPKLDAVKGTMKHPERYDKLKTRYQQAFKIMDTIASKAEELGKATTKKFTSTVETLSQMPLYGAMIVNNAESWTSDHKNYQIAILIVWSPKLERYARNIIHRAPDEKLKSKKTVSEWTKSILPTSVGPRQYTDNKGRRWYIGIAAYPVENGSIKIAKPKAEMNARAMANFAVYADVESWKKAQTVMEEKTDVLGNEDSKVTNSFAAKLAQSLSGVKSSIKLLGEGRFKHPLSHQEMYVMAYGMEAPSSTKADSATSASGAPGGTSNTAANNTVEAYGTGSNRQDAIKSALLEAIRMVNGGYMEADQQLQEKYASIKLKLKVGEESVTASGESSSTTMQKKIRELTQGFIKSYKVISIHKIDDDTFEAKLRVHVMRFDPDNPREGQCTVVVLPFQHGDDKMFLVDNKKRMPAYEVVKEFEEKIRKALVISNKFIVIDRNNMDKILKEQAFTGALVKNKMAPVTEMVKMGNLLGGDFLVTGKLDDIAYKKKMGFNKETKKFGKSETLIIRGEFSLLNVGSGKIELSEPLKIKLTGKDFANLDEDESKYQLILNKAAKVITEALIKKKGKDK